MATNKYARPRLTLVLDNDVVELTKQLAELEQRPVATFAAMVFSDLIRKLAVEKGLLAKKMMTGAKS